MYVAHNRLPIQSEEQRILTAVLALLALDRYLGMNFFSNDFGGNPMMYVNLIWIWGHPEVYILILPAFGVFSEVTATFTGKRLFGYTLDGLCDDRHHASVLHRLAAPLLHHGIGRERQLVLRHHHDDHLDPYGREDVQLAVHDVSRPHPLRAADDVDGRLSC